MENKEVDDIEIVNVTVKPLTDVQLQLKLYGILEKYSKEVPTERDAFIKFVKSKVSSYDDKIINNVWKQVRRLSSQKECSEPICISDEEVEKNDKTEQITLNVVNFDVKEENPERKYIKVKSLSYLIQPISETVNVTKPADRRKRKSNDKPQKRKSNSRKSPDINGAELLHYEAEVLRRKLFVDKLVEVNMPSVLNRKKLKK